MVMARERELLLFHFKRRCLRNKMTKKSIICFVLVVLITTVICFNYFYIELVYLNLHDFVEEDKLMLARLNRKCTKFDPPPPSFDERLNYYLNAWSDNSITPDVTVQLPVSKHIMVEIPFCFDFENYNPGLLGRIELWPETVYGKDVASILLLHPTSRLAFSLGDKFPEIDHFPLIAKTRSVQNRYSVLLKLNSRRHFASISSVYYTDIPFQQKINKVVWRGVTTGFGHGQRGALLAKLDRFQKSSLLDVGYNGIVQGMEKNVSRSGLRSSMSTRALLRYKALLLVEGNDVASGLKWAMMSNSVVFMPQPTRVSWFMEAKLQPWIHYVPLKQDLNDLEEKAKWCFDNLVRCERIALGGQCFAKSFLNRKQERDLQDAIVRHLDKIYSQYNLC